MATNLILTNQKLVLNAYAAILGSTPDNAQFKTLTSFIDGNGRAAFESGINAFLASEGFTQASLATALRTNLGVSTVFTQAQVESMLASTSNLGAFILNSASDLAAYTGTDAGLLAAKSTLQSTIQQSFEYANLATSVKAITITSLLNPTVNTALTVGVDNLTGTAAADLFNAYILNNANTLQSGDTINGGSGADTLFADIGTSQDFAITAVTSSVETVKIRAQAIDTDKPDNNMQTQEVQIDAQRMSGVTNWENNNSRADLLIEDVRILDSQITKNITITMRETDPGHVDYGVYFDQNSLRTITNNTSQINLEVMDTRSVVNGTAPLLNSPYGGFRFTSTDSNGVATVITLQSQAIDDAQTYAQLVTAFQAAADTTLGVGVVTVSLGANFTATDTTTAQSVTGQTVILKANGAFTFTTPTGSGWLANGVVPANSGLHTNFNQTSSQSTDLVTSTVVLDDVGRGSTGGDLVIGGLSVGDTSTSKGVQRFEITVEDNSKLQTINSTSNTLREVTIVNGTTTRVNNAYNENEKNAGYLVVNGTVGAANGINEALPGTTAQHNAYGFSDLRLIDGSAMTGKLEFTAELSERAVTKYLNKTDTAADPMADNVAVVYSGGANNDKMVVDIDAKAVASNSNVNVGKADFTFTFNGGAGNDIIDVAIDRTATKLTGNTEFWYTNQVINNNITVNAGDGNDTIKTPGAGNMTINAGAGNDAVYTDNTGRQLVQALDNTGAASIQSLNATWVFNNSATLGSSNLYDTESATAQTVGSYAAQLTVTYRGLTKTLALADTDYKLTDLEINQAIKKAINEDPVLSKLLLAEDGAGRTLNVSSLTDGTHVASDLAVSIARDTAVTFSQSIVDAYNTANNLTGGAALTTANIGAAIDTNLGTIDNTFDSELATDTAAADIDGVRSSTTSDNLIDGGTGNDVIVLGTTVGANALASSNDKVVYSAAWGDDVILNFSAGNVAGADVLDFRAFLGSTATGLGANQATAAAVASTDSLIQFGTYDNTGTALTGVRNDSAAEVAKLYTDDTTANKGLYVVVDSTDKGTVYQVIDGTAANDMTVTLVGSIDLADTGWSTLTAANFA